jgi:hypothetical protein
MPDRRMATAGATLLAASILACGLGNATATAKLRPPKPVPAWYMTAASVPDLIRQAKNSACTFAKRQSKGGRLMLFDFGAARKYVDGGFGADLRGIHPFRNGAILNALTNAARKYKRCHRRGSATIAYGNSNSLAGSMSKLDAYEAGLHQAQTVRDLRHFQHHRHHYDIERAAAAGDIEPGFGLPGVSKALVNGAHRTAYFDFGNAGGCPGQPGSSGCYNGWDLGDLGEVSMGGHSRPLPEIYRPYEAAQWARIQDRWDGRYSFAGITGAPHEPLSPAQGWRTLVQRAERVGRELISFRDTAYASAARKAGAERANPVASGEAGTPMSTAIRPHVVARPEGFFSTSLIYPLANEWVVSDRRRFVSVDAGADPLDPSTGVLGIFRQNYVRVTQTQRVIEVPGAGELELTAAPPGPARVALSRSPTLRFEGARGIGGFVDLSDGTATLDSPAGGSP